MIKVVLCEVGKEPKVVEIKNDLQTLQEIVGGYIENVTLRSKICLICNEEGMLKGLPFNRCGILGPFILSKANEDDELISLSDSEIRIIGEWCESYKSSPHPSMV